MEVVVAVQSGTFLRALRVQLLFPCFSLLCTSIFRTYHIGVEYYYLSFIIHRQ
jgi:hypothetical protein